MQRDLLAAIAGVAFSDFPMRGVVLSSSGYFRIVLARRSAYLMTEESRTAYDHHIPPVAELRYSVTFRTLR